MAIIKCKMCGGDIELSADKTFGTCEFCGSTMTLPKVDDEQRAAAFNRGNHFRRIGEFDKALAVYERIIREDDTDAEAHWCCALCRFGIEYVEDPNTYEWLPTCHRASFDSFLEDVDYLAAVEHSDGITRRQYQKDAAKIAEVQRGILATSQNEDPFDVFICYKESDENGQRTKDSLMAQDIYYQLTDQGYRVFFARITLEDMAGREYEPYIFAALNSAKVMIVVGTKPEYLNAVWVKNEWSRFLAMMKKDRHKLLLPCYRDMDPYDMPEQLAVLQSYDMGKIGFIQDLTRGIRKVLDAEKKPEPVKETVTVQQTADSAGNVDALLKRVFMFLEDRDWKGADEYCEKVLDIDPENARAYLGKVLAQEQCRTIDAFVRKRKDASQNVKGQTLHLEPNHAHVDKMVSQFSLHGYVGRDAIRKLYDFDLSYPSDVAERKQQYQNEETYWANHKQLSRAEKFAVGAVAESLQREKKALFAALSDRVKQAESAEAAAIADVKARYERHLKQADEKAETMYNDGLARLENDYRQLLQIANTSSDVKKLTDAAKKFALLGDYQDSKNLAEHCRKRAAEEQAKIDAENERQRILKEKQKQAQKAKNKKIAIVTTAVVCTIIAAILLLTKVIIPNGKYNDAVTLMEAGNYQEAIAAFEALEGYRDSEDQILECQYEHAVKLMEAGNYRDALAEFDALDGYKDSAEQVKASRAQLAVQDSISSGSSHTVGLKADGTVVAVGDNEDGQCDVESWRDIIAISAGGSHTVGLKADGTVVAVGYNSYGQRNVTNWSDIIAISAGIYHTVGLKADGTVVAVGGNEYGQCNVASWSDIIAISAGIYHTVGLKADGTVVAVGDNEYTQCNVGSWFSEKWSDIIAISAGAYHTVGLKADGTVVAVGGNEYGQCDVASWRDIKIPVTAE